MGIEQQNIRFDGEIANVQRQHEAVIMKVESLEPVLNSTDEACHTLLQDADNIQQKQEADAKDTKKT